ncbi:MAG: thioesterase family protein [Eubacteriales bacterium]|nr:thioesterase family protein [Eubacteriales bacterium]
MESVTTLTVRYAETDQMGIVHHCVYPIWFEAGRTDFIKQAGISYSEVENRGILLPLIQLTCNYISAAKYEDTVSVTTSLKNITYSRLRMFYQIRANESPKVIASGETLHVWTDANLKPLNLKKSAPDLYELLYRQVSS